MFYGMYISRAKVIMGGMIHTSRSEDCYVCRAYAYQSLDWYVWGRYI